MRKIILASGSVRRKDIMGFLGIPFEVAVSDFPEENIPWSDFDTPNDYVSTIALGKVLTVAQLHPDAIIVGADTGVFLDGKVYGKPKNLDHAREILKSLRGKWHQVVTGIVVLDSLTMQKEIQSVVSDVEFMHFSDQQLEEYIATSESMGKAGAYAIQMGARPFVKSLRGSVSNVVGLPIEETVNLLEHFDVPIDVDISALVRNHFSFAD